MFVALRIYEPAAFEAVGSYMGKFSLGSFQFPIPSTKPHCTADGSRMRMKLVVRKLLAAALIGVILSFRTGPGIKGDLSAEKSLVSFLFPGLCLEFDGVKESESLCYFTWRNK
jgi:hypothetical protein